MSIEVIVNDTSCLIDMRKGGLLQPALGLPFRFVVALPLVEVELNDFTPQDWAALKRQGLKIVDLDGGQVACAMAFKNRFPGLSVYDCFSLALAECEFRFNPATDSDLKPAGVPI